MTPLVLIPGMMCDDRLYGPQIAALEGDRDVRVLPITESDTVAALAADILRAAPERFALAGLSMGGIVAMEVIRQAPDRVERLALMDTNAAPESEAVSLAREPQIARVRAGKLREVMRDELKPMYLADGPDNETVLAVCMEMAMGLGPDVFERQSRALQTRPDQREALRTVAVPTLVLCGAQDRLCPVHRHELICDLIDGARLRIIEGAGHLPTLEKPEAVNAALSDWLRTA